MPYFRKKKKKVADKILPQRVCIEIINTFLACCILDTLSKQFGLRSGPTKHLAWLGSKLFDTLMVLLKDFFLNIYLEKKSAKDSKNMKHYPPCKEKSFLALL